MLAKVFRSKFTLNLYLVVPPDALEPVAGGGDDEPDPVLPSLDPTSFVPFTIGHRHPAPAV